MKRFVISMYVCCCAVFCSCSDDDKLPDVRPAAKGEYTDVRDGNTYGWVRIGDLEWMTENLKYQVGGLPYYECTYDVFGANYPVAVRSQLINTDFEADMRHTVIFIPGRRRWRVVRRGGVCLPMRIGKIWRWRWACPPGMPMQRVGAEAGKQRFCNKVRKVRAWHCCWGERPPVPQHGKQDFFGVLWGNTAIIGRLRR